MTLPNEATPIGKPRWYTPTPGKFVALLLLGVAALYLSDQYDWFAYNKQKGWTVLIAVAFVAAGLMLVAVWAAVAYLVGRRVQLGLATLLFLVGVVALPLAWLAGEVQRARQLSDAIKRLEQAGGKVEFAYDSLRRGKVCSYGTTPAWLRNILGDEFFGEDCAVTFDGPVDFAILREVKPLREVFTEDKTMVTDEDLAELSNVPQLESIYISRSEITDTGLRKLLKMTALKYVLIAESHITDHGRDSFEKNFVGQCLIFPDFISITKENLSRAEKELSTSMLDDPSTRFDNPYSLEYRENRSPRELREALKQMRRGSFDRTRPDWQRVPKGISDLSAPEINPRPAPKKSGIAEETLSVT